MSLFAWKSPAVTDPDEAERLLELEDESVFQASDDVTRFFAQLMELLPPHDASPRRSSRAVGPAGRGLAPGFRPARHR